MSLNINLNLNNKGLLKMGNGKSVVFSSDSGISRFAREIRDRMYIAIPTIPVDKRDWVSNAENYGDSYWKAHMEIVSLPADMKSFIKNINNKLTTSITSANFKILGNAIVIEPVFIKDIVATSPLHITVMFSSDKSILPALLKVAQDYVNTLIAANQLNLFL